MKYIDPQSGCVIAALKTCPKCEQAKPLSEFPWNSDRESPMSRCYACKNRYHRERYAAKRKGAWTSQRTPYKPSEIATLRACIEAGLTLAETAEKMGRTATAVRLARANHCLPPFRRPPAKPATCPRWTDDKLADVARLKVAGHSFSQIGAALQASRNAIGGAMHNHRQRIQELMAHEARIAMGHR